MMGPALAILSVVVVGGGFVLWMLGRKADNRRAARFADRMPLTAAELWEAHYRDTTITVSTVAEALGMIQEAIGISGGTLRPSDRFGHELVPEDGWELDDGLAELRWALEARQRGASQGIETVDDFIRRWSALPPKGHS